MPGFSVWSLIAHAQRDRLLRRAFRQRRAAKQASNVAFVSRRSGGTEALCGRRVSLGSRDKHGTERKPGRSKKIPFS